MFDFIIQKRDKKSRWVGRLLIVSVVVHAIVIGALVLRDQLRVPAMAEPAVTVTFVDFASLPPPPPPPPPPKKRSTPKKTEVKPVTETPKELVAPKDIPDQQKPKEELDEGGEDNGSDEGVEGGVEGGVAGGVVGGVGDSNAKVPAVQAPVEQDQATVRRNRVQGRDPQYPPEAERSQIEATLIARINIDATGHVTQVLFSKTHPMFEHEVRDALRGWVFKPHLVNGRAVPVYTTYKFVFRLQ